MYQQINNNHLTWRIHDRIIPGRVDEVLTFLESTGDRVQIISGNHIQCLAPELVSENEVGGIAVTTLNDARTNLRGSWQFPRLLYFDEMQYNVSNWLPMIDPKIPVLNRQSLFVPAGCIQYMGLSFGGGILPSPEGSIFVRPNSGLKPFTGFVIDCFTNRICGWSDVANKILEQVPDLAPDTLVCVAPGQLLKPLEWRFWIANRRVVACTPYGWDEQPIPWQSPPAGSLAVAEAMAANPWQPDTVYVVDVVQTKNNGRFWLNELNAASTSGWYNVPLEQIVPALREAVFTELKDKN